MAETWCETNEECFKNPSQDDGADVGQEVAVVQGVGGVQYNGREQDVEEEVRCEAGEVDDPVFGVVGVVVLAGRVHDQPDDDPHDDEHARLGQVPAIKGGLQSGSMEWMSHRERRENKQQPSMLPGPAVSGCCLVSFHFLSPYPPGIKFRPPLNTPTCIVLTLRADGCGGRPA